MTSRVARAVAVGATVAALAAGCGSDDTSSSTTADEQSDVGDPQRGGKLIFGLWAESDGWDPAGSRWAPSGIQVSRAIYDTLTVYDVSGQPVPNLAESVTPNEDFTAWTIVVRDGITFHNGETLDAEAVRANLDAYRESPLTGPIYTTWENVEVVDEMTVLLTLNTPITLLPHQFTTQVGVMQAPEALADPNRAQRPIGTGPFVFESWEPDRELNVDRYDDYWRDGLPYVDAITFQPIVNGQTRMSALRSGDITIAAIVEPALIAELEDGVDGVELYEDEVGETDEIFVMLNTKVPPFDDPEVRRILALATDQDALVESLHGGLFETARGPYRESSAFYAETDYPTYDPAAAQTALEAWEEANGPLEITLTTTPQQSMRQNAEYLAQSWGELGIDVTIDEREQAGLIVSVLGGGYEAVLWSQFNARHPYLEQVWWHQRFATEMPEPSLNFARNQDQELSDALDAMRMDPDGSQLKINVDIVQGRLAATIPYVWLYHTEQAIGAADEVHGVLDATTPDGEPAQPINNGAVSVAELWMSG